LSLRVIPLCSYPNVKFSSALKQRDKKVKETSKGSVNTVTAGLK